MMRLVLVGEHSLLLQGLAKLLQDQVGAQVRIVLVPEEVVETVRAWQPDAIIAEIGDVVAGSAFLPYLREAAGESGFVVVAPPLREQFLAALRSGARGFVSHNATAEQLLNCIEAVRRGEWGLPRQLVGELVGEYLALSTAEQLPTAIQLSERELKVLNLLADGMSAQQIGRALFVSEGTVRMDIRALMHKLGVTSRMQIITEASRRGLLDRIG